MNVIRHGQCEVFAFPRFQSTREVVIVGALERIGRPDDGVKRRRTDAVTELVDGTDERVAHAVTCGTRVLLTPIVVGFVEELQRLLAERGHGPAVRWTFAPFALLDRLVSVAPTEASLDVAAAALRELRARCGTPPDSTEA